MWHLLHLAGQLQARLSRLVQAEEECWRVIERQEQHQAETGRRSTRRPTKTTSGEQEERSIQLQGLLQGVRYLFGQLHELFGVVVLTGGPQPRLLRSQSRLEDFQVALELLEGAIASVPLAMPTDQLLEAMGPTWRLTAARLLEAWHQVVRASSVVENWHSLVRPHLAVHRSLSAGLLARLSVCHKHRVAPEDFMPAALPCSAVASNNRVVIGWTSLAMWLRLLDGSHCQVHLNYTLGRER